MYDDVMSPHNFYIPVMGTGFTVDTPLKVAKYGISSAISLVDDVLIEQMREYHCKSNDEQYHFISSKDKNFRTKRITAYLDLLNKLINEQTAKLQASSFEEDTDITKYYQLLPSSPLRTTYEKMVAMEDSVEKEALQETLRRYAVPGSIDVNIMTKLDRNMGSGSSGCSDAVAALRGYAKSTLHSSVIFSAGFNPRVYEALKDFDDFFPNEAGYLKKKIILKVSDYRSAFIQGKYLAKHGLWVSEYRIESALNCGGHAFVNDGYLMGPILEEFKQEKTKLIEMLHGFYNKALLNRDKFCISRPHDTRFSVQGGVGDNKEHQFLLKKYEVDAVGWGTPFLLVPEAVNVDAEHLQKLIDAKEEDVVLSNNSPLGVPFWNLTNSASEKLRHEKIAAGCPGSDCPKQYAKMNTEFTKTPVCVASRVYQKNKLLSLQKQGLSEAKLQKLTELVVTKACICHDLAAVATKKYGIDLQATAAVCPGPNIINFSKIATLEEMINYIYGVCVLPVSIDRVHMFIKELSIHVDFLKDELSNSLMGLASRSQEKLQEVKGNLLNGVKYYRQLAKEFVDEQQKSFLASLSFFDATLTKL